MIAAIFDLGGVLFTNGTKSFISTFAKEHALIEQDVKAVMEGDLGTMYRENKITALEFWQRGLAQLRVGGEFKEYEKQWINAYALIPGTKDVILKLRENGYQVYYLSDNVKERVELLNARFSFLDLFDGGIFSHELGVRKPHPKVYEAMINKYSLDPKQAVFIDDKQENLPPAESLGLNTIFFEDSNRLISQLKEMGFNMQ